MGQTWTDSRNAPGGILDRGRFNRASSGALVGDSNFYDAQTGGLAGNTVSNYAGGVQSPPLATSNGRLYSNFKNAGNQPNTPTPTNPTNPARSGAAGADGGLAADPIQQFLEMFNGEYYDDPTAYFEALLQSIDDEAAGARTRGRDEYGRNKSSLLEQVAQLFTDIDQQERKGQGDITGYYAGLGDIYQSSEDVRRGEFAGDVTKERTRVTKEKDTSLASMDRALDDYLKGVDQTREQSVGKTFNDARSVRSQFAPTANFAAATPGSVNLQDTSALVRNLEQFLSPGNVRDRYRSNKGGEGGIYSYLNPTV